MEIKKINVALLKAAKYNPRKDLKPGNEEFEKLKRSIETFGYVEPVIWNKRTGNVVGGHQRLKVLKHMGFTEVDCVILDIDLLQEKALNVALNKISGEWDMPMLNDLLKDMNASGFDITLTGFELSDLDEYFKGESLENVKEDDFDIDGATAKIKKAVSREGDIWVFGNHRLMCGDSTNSEMVSRLMEGKQANLFLTDPPYNVSYEGTAGKIQNDNQEDGKFHEFLVSAFAAADKCLKAGGSFYIWHADSEGFNFRGACREVGWKVRQCLIWNKNSLVLGRQDYQWKHEPCLYGWKEGESHYWGGDRKQTTVLDFNRPKRSELHPTMKPVELFAYEMMNSSKKGDIVLDLFGGSGTTIIAAEQLDRKAYLMELDAKYVDVIVERYGNCYGTEGIKLCRDGKVISYKDIKKTN